MLQSRSGCRHAWQAFGVDFSKAERAVRLAKDGFAFTFVEGALTQAVRCGHWLLLDEINLGPPEVRCRDAAHADSSNRMPCARH